MLSIRALFWSTRSILGYVHRTRPPPCEFAVQSSNSVRELPPPPIFTPALVMTPTTRPALTTETGLRFLAVATTETSRAPLHFGLYHILPLPPPPPVPLRRCCRHRRRDDSPLIGGYSRCGCHEINEEFAVDQHLGGRLASCHREAKARHGDVIRPRVAATLTK